VSAGIAWLLRPGPSSPALVKFTHTLGEQDQLTGIARQQVAISPDGTLFVYVANNRLYRRPVAEFVSQVITGTEADTSVTSPVFSPDGQWIAYHGASASENAVKRIPIEGGSPTIVVRIATPAGMSWDDSGIVYSVGREGIFRVSPNGGTPEHLVRLEDGFGAWGPQLLPGGEAVLFTLVKAPPGAPFSLWENARVVVQTATQVASGNRVPILAGIRRSNAVGAADFSVSNTGALVYVPGPVDSSARRRWLSISERGGTSYRLKPEPRSFSHPRVSPNGTRLAVMTEDDDDAEILIYELSETSSIRRLTVEGQNRFPVWSFDSERVAFQSDRDGDPSIYWQRADARGGAERLTTAGEDAAHIPASFSPDGRYFLFDDLKAGRYTLHMLSMHDKKSVAFANVCSNEPTGAVFSPDGRWVAYAIGKPGALYDPDRGIFIQPFPPTGVAVQAPKARIDYHPMWARDGKLFYVASAPRPLVFVDVTTQPSIGFGALSTLPSTVPLPSVFSNGARGYDILPDGRVLVVSSDDRNPVEGVRGTAIHVVLNWFEELKRWSRRAELATRRRYAVHAIRRRDALTRDAGPHRARTVESVRRLE
jgi:Tol biopolymer transport system component